MVSTTKMFNQAQIDNLASLHFINNIDDHLKIISSVRIIYADDVLSRVLLILGLHYDGEKIDELSFDLHNYTYEEIVNEVKNIRSNSFIMREVDTYLAGDIE